MPTIKKKPTPRARTRSRVTRAEGNSREADRNPIKGTTAKHRESEDSLMGMARTLENGEVLIANQLSEVVPVGRFAGITIGPAMLAWKLSGANMASLAEVDWDSDEPLTKEQQKAWDLAANALRSTGKILNYVVSEDREVVDEAVRRFNAEELEEEKKEAKDKKAKR